MFMMDKYQVITQNFPLVRYNNKTVPTCNDEQYLLLRYMMDDLVPVRPRDFSPFQVKGKTKRRQASKKEGAVTPVFHTNKLYLHLRQHSEATSYLI